MISKYNHEIPRILEKATVRVTLETQMFVIGTSAPEKFSGNLRQEIEDVGELIKDANIKAQ